ncbi:exodeoxyribonuclease VII small subunit [Bacteroides sp. OttesenSCG-928-J23]|nr:exodeoxyribonuclease VII small subunit [Bacteroides sp. OttesenSCG-928-J23]
MKKETYSEAFQRLEEIVSQIESDELEIDTLTEKVQEANKLIALCTEKLTKIDQEVKKMLDEK